jgi:hypothetical protein
MAWRPTPRKTRSVIREVRIQRLCAGSFYHRFLESALWRHAGETLLSSKIQDILIQRSIQQRLLGLSTVIIQNAMGQPATIPALRAETAAAFRDEALRRVPR